MCATRTSCFVNTSPKKDDSLMAVDTPARIAVLGVGPIGLESALYARFLGYDVDVFERGNVCENLRLWGHVRMFSPFQMNRSTLGLAALRAQHDAWQAPEEVALLTGHQLAEAYYLPLAKTDLLAESIHCQTTVLSVGREGLLKGDHLGDDARRDVDFRILARDRDGQERVTRADVVIDTTGTYGHPNWMGPGGMPAVGERALRKQIEYGLPDVLDEHRDRYAQQHTLVLGAGYSAATTVVALHELAREEPATRVTWVTRGEQNDPITRIADDRLIERDRLAERANRLAMSESVAHWPGTMVQQISQTDTDASADALEFEVDLVGRHVGTLTVDRIVANVGYRPDNRLHEELQVHTCYATDGPMKLAAALSGNVSADCLDQGAYGPATLASPEPDFYIAGAKSYGRSSQFLLSIGLKQIQHIFTMIGDSAELDLYKSIQAVKT